MGAARGHSFNSKNVKAQRAAAGKAAAHDLVQWEAQRTNEYAMQLLHATAEAAAWPEQFVVAYTLLWEVASARDVETVRAMLHNVPEDLGADLHTKVRDALVWQAMAINFGEGHGIKACIDMLGPSTNATQHSQLKQSVLIKARYLSDFAESLQQFAQEPKKQIKDQRTFENVTYQRAGRAWESVSWRQQEEDERQTDIDSASAQETQVCHQAPIAQQSGCHHYQVKNTFIDIKDSESVYSHARQSEPTRQPEDMQAPPGLGEPTARECTPLEDLLDEAFCKLACQMQYLEASSAMERAVAQTALVEAQVSWQVRVHEVQENAAKLADVVREWSQKDGDQQKERIQERLLLVSCILGVRPLLDVLSGTRNFVISEAVYGALTKHCRIRGLSTEEVDGNLSDAQSVVQTVLQSKPSFYHAEPFLAILCLLGHVLQGAFRAGCSGWAATRGLPQDDPKLSLLDHAVRSILDITGWWHRCRMYDQQSAELLQEGLGALQRIFKGSKSLGHWEVEICKFARWLLHDYHAVASALESARSLLERGKQTDRP